MILTKFSQNFLPKYKILVSQAQRTVFFYSSPDFKFVPKSIYQIARFQLQKYKNFPASEGGHIPLRHPPVRASAHLALMRHQITHHVENGSTPLEKLVL